MEERMTDPMTGGAKGRKPERFELLPWDALEIVARVYDYGARKYDAENWARGYPWRWSLGALFRHAARFAQGETVDTESGLPHMAHAAFHCLTLLAFALRRIGTDDRPKRTLAHPARDRAEQVAGQTEVDVVWDCSSGALLPPE